MRIKYYYASPIDKEKRKIGFKVILMYAIALIDYILFFFHKIFVRKKVYKYEVSLCLIFKNEAPYLKEWIEYHRMIGIEHFYLYNNLSDDNYKEVLQPYIDGGIVDFVDWPKKYAQVQAYRDCYLKSLNETHWLGFIDADEFVNLQKDNDIRIFLSRYNLFPSLLLRWKMFGTSGHLKEDYSELVTERFTASWPNLCHIGKSFINNDYSNFGEGIHSFKCYWMGIPLYAVDERKIVSPSMCDLYPYSFDSIAYLNHYWSKSYSLYQYKDKVRGSVAAKKNNQIKKLAGRFEMHELNNSVQDYTIQRWMIFLKLQIKNGNYFM